MQRAVLFLVVLASIGGCASTGRSPAPAPFPRPAGHAGSDTPAPPAPGGSSIVATALALTGTPYRSGGTDPAGFDCSGLVQYAFAQHSIALPRLVADLARTGTPVAADAIEPGDLLFFSTVAPGASHVGIAVGDGTFIHAPSTRGRVRTERLAAPYWRRRFVGARRVPVAP